jgi:Zn-dependent protease with chaperone function/Zn-finger nucleic acid-binding protein
VAIETAKRKTIFEVEREKRWRIWLLFALLLLLVYAAVWVACLVVALSVYIVIPDTDVFAVVLDWRNTGVILAAALVFSLVYWYVARLGARRRLLRAMHCRPLDPHDRYHQRLANIAEEMRIASGAPRVDCVTVSTLGMNAFAFSDLRGAGVIGVTEGALARLSRPQLQAVVAHEFAHILSGTYVTATVSCLLFGIYSELGDRLDTAASGEEEAPWAMLGLTAAMLRVLLAFVQVASRVASSALSRERELEADVAAARYTRDPLSLAQALRMIGRHPHGGGYIPEGLAPLCIRATEDDAGRPLERWQATHPPLGMRIDRLLALAHVTPSDFESQADQAAERFDEREHAARPPADAAGRATALASFGLPAAGASAAPPADAGAATVAPPAPAGAAARCPSCGGALRSADYEGIPLRVCPSCGGRLASSDQVRRIAARREVAFSAEQQHLADLLVAQGDDLRRAARLARGRAGVRLVACPQCGTAMMRRHYSYEHAVEVDFCNLCDLYWFEKDELEALQILLERQAT